MFGDVPLAIKIYSERFNKRNETNPSEHSGGKRLSDKDLHSEFLYEVDIMASIPPSEYIVQLLGYQESNPCAIIMKFYQVNLKILIHHPSFYRGPFMSLKIAMDISKGLQHLHVNNILHLDVKPENVLIEFRQNQKFKCLLCDFGYSSRIASSETEPPRLVGVKLPRMAGLTWRYAAPELYETVKSRGRLNQECDKKIDVYAFAMTMFEAISGKPAWSEVQKVDAIKNLVSAGKRPVFSEILEIEYSNASMAHFLPLIEQCWAQNPQERPTFDNVLEILVDESSCPTYIEPTVDVQGY